MISKKMTKSVSVVVMLSMMLSAGGAGAYAAEGTGGANPVVVNSTVLDEDEVLRDLQKQAIDMGIGISSTDTLMDLYEKINDAREYYVLKELLQNNKALSSKLNGLSLEEAKNLLLKDISMVQSNDPKILIGKKLAIEALLDKQISYSDQNRYKASLIKLADELGVDIQGLSVKAAITKLKTHLGKIDTSEATNSFQLKQLLDAVYAIRTKNATSFMAIVKSGAFDDIMKTEMSKLNYDKARTLLIEALKHHTGVDITKGSWESVKAQLMKAIRAGMEEEAKYYGVVITGLSDADAQAKIEVGRQIMMANEMIELAKYAAMYGIDVTGLSKEDGWAKVKAFVAEQDALSFAELKLVAASYNIDITGLEPNEASEKVKSESVKIEASRLGIDITGLKLEEAWRLIKETQEKSIVHENTLEQEAAKFNVDITGLSPEEAKAKIEAAQKLLDQEKSIQPPTPPTGK